MSLVWSPGFNGVTDPDAQTYIAAVEAADGQAIEGNVAYAINDFVVGCKLDGIWDAIKASCILAGARSLSGALVPLKGTAPTNVNFVSGDYNRETGLVGNGSTKYLDSNRSNAADPQNSNHNAIYLSSTPSGTQVLMGSTSGGSVGENTILAFGGNFALRNRTSNAVLFSIGTTVGFLGHNRNDSGSFQYRANNVTTNVGSASQTPNLPDIGIFANGDGTAPTSTRLAFYSIGESLDLALLDARVSTLMTDIGAAIP